MLHRMARESVVQRRLLLTVSLVLCLATGVKGFASPPQIRVSNGFKLASVSRPSSRSARRSRLYPVALCHHDHHHALLVHIGTSLPHAWFKDLGAPSSVPVLQAIFLASNIAYLVAAARTYKCRSRPKIRAAITLVVVSMVSFFFHYHQCVLGVRSPIVHAWCLFDSTCAVGSTGVFLSLCAAAVLSRGGPSPRLSAAAVLAAALLSHTGPLYTFTHSAWHCLSAAIAFWIMEERDAAATATVPGPAGPPPHVALELFLRRRLPAIRAAAVAAAAAAAQRAAKAQQSATAAAMTVARCGAASCEVVSRVCARAPPAAAAAAAAAVEAWSAARLVGGRRKWALRTSATLKAASLILLSPWCLR